MDYHPETLAGPSPWASSSPQQQHQHAQPRDAFGSPPQPPRAPSFQAAGAAGGGGGSGGASHVRQRSDESEEGLRSGGGSAAAVLDEREDEREEDGEGDGMARRAGQELEQERERERGLGLSQGNQQQQQQYQQQGQQQQQQQGPPKQASQRYHGPRPGSRQNVTQYKLQAKVTGLERTGRKDPVLRFDVYTNLPGFRTTQFRDVRRTHSEFVKLAEHLISSSPEAFVPAVPPAQTSAGVGTDEDEARVKVSMQRWLNVVCANEVLMRDDEIVRFVEGDPGYSPVVRISQPATGVRRKVIKQFAPPPDDTPELQEARPIVKMFYLGTMDAGQKVDKVVKVRRALGLAEVDFGAKLAAVADQESHAGLKHACRKLGKIIQNTGDFHAAQGTAEATVLGDPLQYHSADAFIVKETLTNRHILLRELHQAQTATRAKLSATDRLKASTSVRRDKVDEAISALDEARSHEAHLAAKAERVTLHLRAERARWFARTAADARAALREYVLRSIDAERRTLALLESARPDIRAIDASGGLSRLGRESHPAARRASLMSSQGPKGDAWSGVQRRGLDGLNRSISGGFMTPGIAAGGIEEGVEGEGGEGEEGNGLDVSGGAGARGKGRKGSLGSLGKEQEEEEDKVDARNAASRLAASTF